MKVVISQPMFFPWIGLFEQINLSDVYIHLDDVQIPGGSSFINRVQLKGSSGKQWWNAPIHRPHELCKIRDVEMDLDPIWIKKSQRTLDQILSGLPYKDDSLGLFCQTVKKNFNSLAEFNIFLIESISNYLGINTIFKKVKRGSYAEDNTESLISILKEEQATSYISGLGGLNYLKKDLFDLYGINLQFMKYENKEYKQKFGAFNPYVSILHPIAAMGKDTRELLVSGAEDVQNFYNIERNKND